MSSRHAFLALGLILVLSVGGLAAIDFARGVGLSQGYAPPQPIAFSHQLHAGERQVPCLYCHYGAERSRHAGIPALSVCMGCHRQIDKESLELARLRDAVEMGRPIRWLQVHKLPDFVFFSHRRHVGAGVECGSCHGPVETMEVLRQEAPLSMGWCLDCHRQRGVTEDAAKAPAGAGEEDSTGEAAEGPHGGPLPATGGLDCSKCHV